tara:strand:- start:849 stop:1028 length:180 start_codon:yes stop_codon:yes gene_type:complete
MKISESLLNNSAKEKGKKEKHDEYRDSIIDRLLSKYKPNSGIMDIVDKKGIKEEKRMIK